MKSDIHSIMPIDGTPNILAFGVKFTILYSYETEKNLLSYYECIFYFIL